MKNACLGSWGILLSLLVGACSASSEGEGGASLYANSTLEVSRSSGIPANGDAQVTLTVTLMNASSTPVAHIPLAIQATGDSNELNQEESTTDESGVVTATLRSRKAEGKSISVVLLDGEGAELETLDLSATVYFGDLFGEAQLFGTGESPRGMVAADYDGDGLMDVATASGNEDAVTVLSGEVLQNPDLVQSYASQEVGLGPRDVAQGDVDGDGDVDLVSANENEDSVTVLTNRGNGSFLREDFSVGEGPRKVILQDLNGDGYLDVVTLNNGTSAEDRISLLLGSGSGTFGNPTHFPTGEGPSSLAVGDVDGDGDLDLVVSNATDANVLILTGNGSGAFVTGDTYATGVSPQMVAVGDLNRDGILDLVVGNDDNTMPLSILLGEGDGTFAEQLNPPVGNLRVRSLVVDDFNGDLLLDVAFSHGDEVSVILGDGWGTFDEPLGFSTQGTTADALFAQDITGDGVLDLLVANRGSANVSFFTVAESFTTVIEGQCDGVDSAFAADVLPLFSSQGCTGCHGDSSPSGGLNLATGDIHAALLAGRVSTSNPESSEILTKPSGQVSHGGGTFFTRTSDTYRTIFCWIEAGALDD